MHPPTLTSLRACLRRLSSHQRAPILTIAVVALAAVAMSGAAAGVAGPAEILAPTDLGPSAERVVATTTTSSPPVAPASATRVPDARPGDLRLDPEADVLPADYVAPPAAAVIRDITYGPDPRHRMDLYLPDVTEAPVVAFLHSGGWVGGDRAGVPDLVLRFTERGYAVASIDYRLAPEHPFPAPVHDVKRAIRELKVLGDASAAIDSERIVLYGTSAGGHLAAYAAATVGEFIPDDLTASQAAHDSSVDAIVVVVGPTDLAQMYEQPNAWARPMSGAHAGCEPCTAEELAGPSVGNVLDTDMPPAYWAYGALDPLVDAELQGRVVADAWATMIGAEGSFFDVVESGDHNLDETLVNQRQIESFVDHALLTLP